MSDQFAHDGIPKQFEIMIYTHYCYHSEYKWAIGTISHDTYDRSGDTHICVAQTPLTVHVPEQQHDIKKMVIDALEKEKKKQMAEYHKKMFELQEKIDRLLCLEYKPVPKADIACENDLPF